MDKEGQTIPKEGTGVSEGANKLQYDPFRRLEPLLCKPAPLSLAQDGKITQAWLNEESAMSEWLILFYDLVVVAILTVFTSSQEIRSASAIGVYFSYFVILWFVWFTQTLFDVRYAANDVWNRLCKLCQLCAFVDFVLVSERELIQQVYFGAASGGWAPTLLQKREDPNSADAVRRNDAATSFRVTGISYAVMRGILIVQYLVVLLLARRAHRPKRAIFMPIIGLSISLSLVIVATALSPTSTGAVAAKLTLFYASMVVELCFEAFAASHETYVRVPAARLHERLGALSLIILGEGFILILKADQVALSSFSLQDKDTYTLVFCTIGIVFFLFVSLFLKNPECMGKKRGMLWAALHFPLHFTILLLLSALVNNIIYRAYTNGTASITDQLVSYVYVIEQQRSWPPPNYDEYTTTIHLNKLDLEPSWSEQFESIGAALASNGNPGPQLLAYTSQVIYKAAYAYKVPVPDESLKLYKEISKTDTNPANYADSKILSETIQELGQNLYDMQTGITNELVTGTLWLFPAAGFAFILIACINLVRHDHHTMRKHTLPVSEILQLITGVILALLGMLAIGENTASFTFTGNTAVKDPESPYLRLTNSDWAIPVVLILYAISFYLSLTILHLMRKHQRRSATLSPQRTSAIMTLNGKQAKQSS